MAKKNKKKKQKAQAPKRSSAPAKQAKLAASEQAVGSEQAAAEVAESPAAEPTRKQPARRSAPDTVEAAEPNEAKSSGRGSKATEKPTAKHLKQSATNSPKTSKVNVSAAAAVSPPAGDPSPEQVEVNAPELVAPVEDSSSAPLKSSGGKRDKRKPGEKTVSSPAVAAPKQQTPAKVEAKRPVAAADAAVEPSFANSPFADADVDADVQAEEASSIVESEAVESEQLPPPKTKPGRVKRGSAEAQPSYVALAEASAEEEAASPALAAQLPVDGGELQAEDEWAEDTDDADTLAASLNLEDKPVESEPEDDGPKLSDEEENHRYLKGLIEALLFSAEKPLSLRELARAARLDKKRATDLLKEVTRDYRKRGMHVVEIAGGYGFRSSPVYAPYVQKLLSLRPVRLSRAQLETLAVIAYRQPVTRPEVDDVRGVDSGQVIKGLLERDLIKMMGKKDEVGRPMLYGTTPAFLELFSLESLKDLPNLREFTELSDASREKFKEAMGENAPGGELGVADALADETEAAIDFDVPSDPEAAEAEPSDPEAAAEEAEAEPTDPEAAAEEAEAEPSDPEAAVDAEAEGVEDDELDATSGRESDSTGD